MSPATAPEDEAVIKLFMHVGSATLAPRSPVAGILHPLSAFSKSEVTCLVSEFTESVLPAGKQEPKISVTSLMRAESFPTVVIMLVSSWPASATAAALPVQEPVDAPTLAGKAASVALIVSMELNKDVNAGAA